MNPLSITRSSTLWVRALLPSRTQRGGALPTYIGKQFESICLQWIQRKNAAGELPFPVFEFGQWWGTNPKTREQVDIDVVAANRNEKRVFVGGVQVA